MASGALFLYWGSALLLCLLLLLLSLFFISGTPSRTSLCTTTAITPLRADAAVAGSGSKAFGLTVQKPFWLKAPRPRST